MLRVLDPRDGVAVDLPWSRDRVGRLCVCADERLGFATLLRALLLADVIARVAELRGAQIMSVLALAGPPGDRAEHLKTASAALNIHPPGAITGRRDGSTQRDEPADLRIAGHPPDSEADPVTPWIRVGAVRPDDALDTSLGPEAEPEPLAVRLALLSTAYQQPITLDRRTVSAARTVLEEWRYDVATWANHPSHPAHAETVHRGQEALDDDLDTARVLCALRDLGADSGVSGGAKFETFAYLDRVLGLDLTRYVGRLPA